MGEGIIMADHTKKNVPEPDDIDLGISSTATARQIKRNSGL